MTPVDDAEVLELEVEGLLDLLSRDGATPASGSVAALVVALAAALVEKAARRSRGAWDGAGGAIAQAQALRLRSAPLADSDARAYREAAELLEGGGRDFELGRALARAAEVPLLIAQVGADVAALAKEVADNAAGGVRADAAAAAVLAAGATRAAAHLVAVNLGTTSEDLRVHSASSLAASAETWAASALASGR